MGMIIKDGIPYGGIYPIDDAPTQGSNNAVKSGGVFGSLSNKVDKVAGKGLSTNDYDNTEKEQNEANAEAIEAIVEVNGCCNVFAIDNPISLSNVRVAYNGIVNTEIDPLDFFDCKFRAYIGGSYTVLAAEYIGDDGNYSFTVSIPSNATKLQLKHNGVSRDLSIEIPTVPAGTYKLTFTVDGHNPSTVGGLAIRNIMLYDARLNPTGYVPYAMTNRELTGRAVIENNISIGAGNNYTYKLPKDMGKARIMTISEPNPYAWSWAGIVIYEQFGNFLVFDLKTATSELSVEGAADGIKISNLSTGYVANLAIRLF